MEDLKANSTATPGASGGNVFAVQKKVLADAAEAMAKNGKESKDINKVLAILNDPEAAKNAEEKELDALSVLAIMELMAYAD